MAGLYQIEKAASPALDLDTAVKNHLRIDAGDTSNDDTLEALIAAATDVAEKYTARSLVTQTWRQYFDRFPGIYGFRHLLGYPHGEHHHHRNRHLELQRSPCVSVEAIKYLDVNEQVQTVDSALYMVQEDVEPVRIRLVCGAQWPCAIQAENSVWVEYTAGYGEDESKIPQTIKQAMLLLISHWYENREPVQDLQFKELPFAVSALLDMNRVWYA